MHAIACSDEIIFDSAMELVYNLAKEIYLDFCVVLYFQHDPAVLHQFTAS